MSNEEFQMNIELMRLIEKHSIVLLTKQKITMEMIEELNEQLINVYNQVEKDISISKELASTLFDFYVTAHTEISYRSLEDKTSRLFMAHLQSNMNKIFGCK